MSARAEDRIKRDGELDQSPVASQVADGGDQEVNAAKEKVQLSQLPWGSWLFEQISVVSRLGQLTKRRM